VLCYTWNVNGIRALARKGILPWKVLSRADLICLQETKAHPGQLPPEIGAPKGWHAFWHSAARPGYSGTAVFARRPPDEVIAGLGAPKFDREGRVLALRYGELVVVSAYFPNSQEGGARLGYKLGFCRALLRWLRAAAAAGRSTLLLGDYNIAHQPIDLARPKENEESPGYLPEERAWMTRYLDAGFHDVFRERNPTLAGAYSWWSLRSGARERNVGWRIDYGTVSANLCGRVRNAAIHPEVLGSDHCPVSVRLS
jgi:exodeoxyribonuclease-3